MDELDQERSTAQTLAAAGAAAALFAGIALAATRKRNEPITVAPTPHPAKATRSAKIGDVADQVAAVAPEVMEILDRHAPATAKRLRDSLPLLRHTRTEASDEVDTAKKRFMDTARSLRQHAAESPKEPEVSRSGGQIDLADLSPDQATAARAAATAVARAEQALDAVGSAGGRSRATSQEAADEVAHSVREVAQHAAEVALDLWQSARGRVEATVGETAKQVSAVATESALDAREKTRDVAAEASDRAQGIAHDVAEKAHDLTDRAKKSAHDAAESTIDTSKESVSALAWLTAAVALIVFVLLKPERRESLTRFTDEAIVQVQELLRDVRGYDDEF